MKSTIVYALRKAAETQLRHFGNKLEFEQKDSQSAIVTRVDLECEETILDVLKKATPEHNIISEEGGLIDNKSEFTWVVDPLDGTSNYVAGIPWFGILIALFKNSRPIAGGAYLPIQNDLYYAESGLGAFKNKDRIKVSTDDSFNQLASFSTDFTDSKEEISFTESLYSKLSGKVRNIRSTNSLLEMLYVAEGKFGGCINLHTKIWDIAAPWIIIREAGGNLANLDGSEINFSIAAEEIDKNYAVLGGGKQFFETIK